MADAPTAAPEAPAPAPVAAPAEQAAPVASAPAVLTSMADLDARMAQVKAADTAQRLNPTPAEPETPEPAPSPTPEAQPSVQEDAPNETPVTPAESVQDDATESSEPGDIKPNGRMAKLREQLLAADARVHEAEARLQERQAADAVVRQRYAQIIGTPDEKSQLEATIADQNTTYEALQNARTRLAQMRQASEELAPIYTAIQSDVFRQFTEGLNALRDMPGMDAETHQKLFKAASGPDALKIMHAAGQAAAREEFQGEIASLKAANADLKTRLAASAAQPAAGGGKAPASTNRLAQWMGPDGFPTEEAIALARTGGLRSLGVSQ